MVSFTTLIAVGAFGLAILPRTVVGAGGGNMFERMDAQLRQQQPKELIVPLPAVMPPATALSWKGHSEDEICAPPYTLPLQVTVGAPCEVTCVVCTTDGGHTWIANATARLNVTVDKSVGMGQPNINQTLALLDSIFRLLNSMDTTLTTEDCACFATDIPEAVSCTLRVGYCAYVAPINSTGKMQLLFRARAWDVAHPEYNGTSPGYINLMEGAASQELAALAAVNNLRKNFPARQCGSVTPIVIFPGFTSSLIQYRMENSPPPAGHPFCPRSSPNGGNWTTLYPPVLQNPLQLPCVVSTIESEFDSATSTFQPLRKGLETRELDFGGFDGMPGFAGIYTMFLISGWEVGKTIFGVPFDWRMPSPALENTYDQMKELIENVTALNGGSKVSVWAFSGGPQPTLGFFHRQSQPWKDQYIHYFVATSPVWGGVGEAPAAFISGSVAPVNGPVNASMKLAYEEIRGIARGLPAALWYFPRGGTNATTSWTKDETVVKTKTKSYTAFDAVQMLTDLGVEQSQIDALKFLAAEPDLGEFAHPGVNTMVTYGTGFDSIVGLEFNEDFTSTSDLILPVSVTTETGDNLVPLRSSLRSLEWALPMKAAGKQFIQREYAGQPHAACFPMGLIAGANIDVGAKCFRDVLDAILS